MNTLRNVVKNWHLTTAAMIAVMTLGGATARAEASLAITSGLNGCYDLLAGQTIDAGDVCFTTDTASGTLFVTYYTYGGWELTEAHLWVGQVQDGYPHAKNGNPKIGNFPYNSGPLAGATTYSFSVPLGSVQSFFDLDNLTDYCDQSGSLYAMAHAAVRRVDGSGTVVQTETGWSQGEGAVAKGSWALRSVLTLSVICDDDPPPPPVLGQETALMFGSIELNNDSDGICDGEIAANRWGWQEGPLTDGSYRNMIYAAAGQNDLSKGTEVGYVDIVVSTGNVTVTPVLYTGFTAEQTHIYIGTAPVCSAAFGKDWKSLASTDLDTSNGVYVGVHFSVLAECQDNGNFCESNEN